MKLLNYLAEDGTHCPAWLDADGALYAAAAEPILDPTPGVRLPLHLDDLRLTVPIHPRNIVGLAANFHGATGQSDDMSEPLVFLKPSTAITDHAGTVVLPFPDTKVWGESEIGVVVGARLYRPSRAEAAAAIFGYIVINDVTAENCDGRDHHLLRAKGADGFCPVGPWVDPEWNPVNRRIQAWHNGDLIRDGNSDQRIWNDAECLYRISQWMTLLPGDLVITGTPPRCSPRKFLAHGDVFECEIAGLGRIRNQFIEI